MPNFGKADLLQFALGAAESEYKELSDTWRMLDGKAQATTAVSGIFVAVALAYMRDGGATVLRDYQSLIILTLLALLVSVVLAVISMLVRTVPMAPSSENALAMVKDLVVRPNTELDDRYEGLLGDTLESWLPVNQALRATNGRKADWLRGSQISLLVAAALVSVVALLGICSIS